MCGKSIPLLSLFLVLSVGLYNAHGDIGGLVGYWKLNETYGMTALDSSGNGNNGTLSGDLTWIPTGGRSGGALLFGGTETAYVELLTTGMSDWLTSRGTVAMWAYLSYPQPTQTRYFFGHTTQHTYHNRIQLYMNDQNTNLDLGLGDSHTRRLAIATLETETWYHLALTWDNGDLLDNGYYRVYVNGSLKADGSYTGLSYIHDFAWLGNAGDPDEAIFGFGGILDEVRMYNRPLSASEIETIAFSSGSLLATAPSPAHGSQHFDSLVTLSWTPGDTAVLHDVYVGTSYSSVYNARKYNGTSAFRDTRDGSTMILGFPGFPYPDGLVPGTTYYWRIDEVEADGTTHRGSVWNFSVQEYVPVWILEEEQTIPQSRELRIVDMQPDLTAEGVNSELVVVFKGNPEAIPSPIYVKITDSQGMSHIVTHPDRSISLVDEETVWRIDLNEFKANGVDVTDVKEVATASGVVSPIGGDKNWKCSAMYTGPTFDTVVLNVYVYESDGQLIDGAELSIVSENVIVFLGSYHDALEGSSNETRHGKCTAATCPDTLYRITVEVDKILRYDGIRRTPKEDSNWEIKLEPIGGGDNGADKWEDATPIGNVTNQAFDTTHATNDGYDNSIEGPNIWYCYTATCDGTVTVSLCGSSFDTRLDIYDDCDSFPSYETAIPDAWDDDSCDKQSETTFEAIKDHKYLIEVGGYKKHAGPGLISIWCEE